MIYDTLNNLPNYLGMSDNLEDEMFDSSDGMLTQRYWIENR